MDEVAKTSAADGASDSGVAVLRGAGVCALSFADASPLSAGRGRGKGIGSRGCAAMPSPAVKPASKAAPVNANMSRLAVIGTDLSAAAPLPRL